MASILPLPPAVVGELVGRSHMDLEKVRQLVAEYPTAIHAAWDWGNGDWETPLGAASHSGRRDIAEFLLSRGARLDIFAAAMLGKLSVVRAMLEDHPAALHMRGPHGIGLLEHARAGKHAGTIAHLEKLLEPEKKKGAVRAAGAPRRGRVAAAAVARGKVKGGKLKGQKLKVKR